MRINRNHITAILAAGAAAVAIAAAPTASAAPTAGAQSCSAVGNGGTECQSPGNVQIYDSPPPVDIDPYGGYGLALGGFGDGFRGGGFHGGGGGHR